MRRYEKRRRHGAKQRGAAMLESTFVMAVMVATWGAMAMAFTGGSAKLAAQWNARASVMYYASNECKKQMPGAPLSTHSADGSLDDRSGNRQADRALDGAPLGQTPEARSNFFIASSAAQSSRSLQRWSATKESSSWALCNESAYPGTLPGLVAYGADLFFDLLPGPVQAIFR